ncbi:unnamed protein product, partial [Amoebophrya sp. A25]
ITAFRREQIRRTLLDHLNAGFRCFDTIDSYGEAESLLGDTLDSWLSEPGRGSRADNKIQIFTRLD